MTNYTVALIKPDGVAKGLIGTILEAASRSYLYPVDLKFIRLREVHVNLLYAEHIGKDFFQAHSDFMQGGLSLAILLEYQCLRSSVEAYAAWREIMGPTDPLKVTDETRWTIRGRFGERMPRNVVHGSDSEGSVVREATILGLRKKMHDPE